MVYQDRLKQSGKTLFIIALVGALMAVVIGFNFFAPRVGQVFSPSDERNQLAVATDSKVYNLPAYQNISANVKAALGKEAQLSEKAKNVYVHVVDGVIVLSGEVKSRMEQMEVVKLAREQAGMAKVDDQLEVVPGK